MVSGDTPLCPAPKPSHTPAHISGEPPLQVFSRRVRPPSPSRLPATFSSLAPGSRLLAPAAATGVLGSCCDSCSILLYTCKVGKSGGGSARAHKPISFLTLDAPKPHYSARGPSLPNFQQKPTIAPPFPIPSISDNMWLGLCLV